MGEKSLQETYAPKMARFGCGPANEKGLHIRSFSRGDEVVATFNPETYQEAFPGMAILRIIDGKFQNPER